MHTKILWILFSCYTFCLPAYATVAVSDAVDLHPLNLLNKIRAESGLQPLSMSETLTLSAQNHAAYISRHNLPAQHIEDETQFYAGFTGKTPVERALHSGYKSRLVAENVSSGQTSYQESIDGLMSAVYHRLVFLNPVYNEIGLARVPYARHNYIFTYLLGNRLYNQMCHSGAALSQERFYTGICEPNFPVDARLFETTGKVLLKDTPDVVIWPPEGASQVMPVFYEESPDPLPDVSVSGYPVSVQFNTLKLPGARLLSMDLFDFHTGQKINNVRLLNRDNDPNQLLRENEYVLFPMQRLKNDNTYQVTIHYASEHQKYTKSWQFKTRPLSSLEHVYTINENDKTITIPYGLNKFVLFFPPNSSYPSFDAYHIKYSQGMSPQINFIDQNTLEVALSPIKNSEMLLTLSDQRQLKIQVRQAYSSQINSPQSHKP